jgi:hypothetical protein
VYYAVDGTVHSKGMTWCAMICRRVPSVAGPNSYEVQWQKTSRDIASYYSLSEIRKMLVFDGEVEVLQELGNVLSGLTRPIHPSHIASHYSFDSQPLYPFSHPPGSSGVGARCTFERI